MIIPFSDGVSGQLSSSFCLDVFWLPRHLSQFLNTDLSLTQLNCLLITSILIKYPMGQADGLIKGSELSVGLYIFDSGALCILNT